MPEPLTEDQLRKLVEQLIGDSDAAARDAEYDNRRNLLYMRKEREPKIPDIPLPVKWMAPDILIAGNKYKNRKLAAPLKLKATAQGEGERLEAKADRIERFCKRHHEEWLAEQRYDGALFDQDTVGAGVLHLYIDPEIMPVTPLPGDDERPDTFLARAQEFLKTEKRSPFRLESVDYASIYHSYDWDFVAQKIVTPLHPLSRAYLAQGVDVHRNNESGRLIVQPAGAGTNERQIDQADKVTLIIVETTEYVYHLVTEEAANYAEAHVLGVAPNIFGRPGYVVVPGEVTGDPRPLYRYVPTLIGMYSSVPHENLMGTLKLIAGLKAGQMHYALEPVNKDNPPDGAAEIEIQDGVLVPPQGWKITAPKLDVGFDLNDAFSIARDLTREFAFPAALDRPDESSATSGYQQAVQQDSVSSLLDPLLNHWAAAVRQIFLMMLTAVREFDADVTVRTIRPGTRVPELPASVAEEVTLSKDDAADVDLAVTFDSVQTYTRQAMLETGMTLREAGAISESEFQTVYRDVEDYGQFLRRRDRDAMRIEARAWALEDARAAVSQLRAAALGRAVTGAGVDPNLAREAGMQAPPNLSMPSGGGGQIDVVPPEPEELAIPRGTQTQGAGYG